MKPTLQNLQRSTRRLRGLLLAAAFVLAAPPAGAFPFFGSGDAGTTSSFSPPTFGLNLNNQFDPINGLYSFETLEYVARDYFGDPAGSPFDVYQITFEGEAIGGTFNQFSNQFIEAARWAIEGVVLDVFFTLDASLYGHPGPAFVALNPAATGSGSVKYIGTFNTGGLDPDGDLADQSYTTTDENDCVFPGNPNGAAALDCTFQIEPDPTVAAPSPVFILIPVIDDTAPFAEGYAVTDCEVAEDSESDDSEFFCEGEGCGEGCEGEWCESECTTLFTILPHAEARGVFLHNACDPNDPENAGVCTSEYNNAFSPTEIQQAIGNKFTGNLITAPDTDGDGVIDSADTCGSSDTSATITMGSHATGVNNQVFPDGCSMSDALQACLVNNGPSAAYVNCVNNLTKQWVQFVPGFGRADQSKILQAANRIRYGY